MADKKQTVSEKAAPDPTVYSTRGRGPEYPEGTHPPVPPADQAWGPDRFSYSDMDDKLKPDESTVAQTVDADPLQEQAQNALRESAEKAGRDANQAALEKDRGGDNKTK